MSTIEDQENMKKWIAAEMRSDRVQNVSVTDKRARRWLAERNIALRLADRCLRLVRDPEEVNEQPVGAFRTLAETLTRLADEIESENKKANEEADDVYGLISALAGRSYQFDGYHVLNGDINTQPEDEEE